MRPDPGAAEWSAARPARHARGVYAGVQFRGACPGHGGHHGPYGAGRETEQTEHGQPGRAGRVRVNAAEAVPCCPELPRRGALASAWPRWSGRPRWLCRCRGGRAGRGARSPRRSSCPEQAERRRAGRASPGKPSCPSWSSCPEQAERGGRCCGRGGRAVAEQRGA